MQRSPWHKKSDKPIGSHPIHQRKKATSPVAFLGNISYKIDAQTKTGCTFNWD